VEPAETADHYSPAIVAVLSVFWPGSGHIYIGRIWRGVWLFMGGFMVALLNELLARPISSLIPVVYWALSAYDAYRQTKRHNEKLPRIGGIASLARGSQPSKENQAKTSGRQIWRSLKAESFQTSTTDTKVYSEWRSHDYRRLPPTKLVPPPSDLDPCAADIAKCSGTRSRRGLQSSIHFPP